MKMNGNHLSTWEQEAYILSRNTSGLLDTPGRLKTARHLEECAACTSAVAQLEYGIGLFRDSAIEWSSQCLESRLKTPLQPAAQPPRRLPLGLLPSLSPNLLTISLPAMRWAMAAALFLLALLPLYFLASRHATQLASREPVLATSPAQGPASNDDALLQEVDQQVSESVPDSMESLTHLVTTTESKAAITSGAGSGPRVETN